MEQLYVVLGNGETRKGFDLTKLEKHITFGCNSLCRDFHPTYLIAVDRRCVEEAVDYGVSVYTRPRWHSSFAAYPYVQYLPELPYKPEHKADEPMNWGSGTYAAYLACLQKPKKIYFLGFDIYSMGNRHNNIYKGTPNYDGPDRRPVDPSYWIYQINKLHQLFPEISFIHVLPGTWPKVGSWNSQNRIWMTTENFIKVLDKS